MEQYSVRKAEPRASSPFSTSFPSRSPPQQPAAAPASPAPSKEVGEQGAPSVPLPVDESKKTFAKGKSFERDIAVLSATYILDESPELKDLIKLVILIRDKDDVGQVIFYP